MYFTGRLFIDPSQETVIERHEFKGPFMKILNFLTSEDLTPEEEHETFSAVSMLSNLRVAFQEAGVTNIIRLTKNQVTFYVDEEGQDNDLDHAVDGFVKAMLPSEEEAFETLSLALEHRENGLHFLIEVHVEKSHDVGAFPLKIKVNAFPDMQFPEAVSSEWLADQLLRVCNTQEVYDKFVSESRAEFGKFLDKLESTIGSRIEVDKVEKKVGSRLIRPKGEVLTSEELDKRLSSTLNSFFPQNFDQDPIFSGYPGFQSYLLSCFQWGGLCFQNQLLCKELEVIDERGRPVMQIGATGIFAGATNTLNPSADFEAAKGGDIVYFDENSFFNEMDRLGLVKH